MKIKEMKYQGASQGLGKKGSGKGRGKRAEKNGRADGHNQWAH